LRIDADDASDASTPRAGRPHLAQVELGTPFDHIFFFGVVVKGQDHPRHRPAGQRPAGAFSGGCRGRTLARPCALAPISLAALAPTHRWRRARTRSASAAATATCRSPTCCRCATAASRAGSTAAGTGISSVMLRQAPALAIRTLLKHELSVKFNFFLPPPRTLTCGFGLKTSWFVKVEVGGSVQRRRRGEGNGAQARM